MLCSDSVRSFVRKLVFVWLLWNLRIEKGSKDWNLMCYVPFCLFICLVLFWFLENENSSRLRIIFVCNWLDEAVVFCFCFCFCFCFLIFLFYSLPNSRSLCFRDLSFSLLWIN